MESKTKPITSVNLGPEQSIVQSLVLALEKVDTKVGSLLLTTNHGSYIN